jgi:predicted TIM-barrel fold metal-dependent hydrolase
MQAIFDTHAHLVTQDKMAYPPRPLRGVLAPGEFDDPNSAEKFLAACALAGVASACAVQRAHVYGYDNSYILDCSRAQPERLRAVVVLNAASADTPGALKQLVIDNGAAGVRYVSPGFPRASLDWLTSKEAHASFAAAADLGVPICVHVLHVQRDAVLPEVLRLAKTFSGAAFVVDHVGGAHPAHIERQWLREQGLPIGAPLIDAALILAECANVTMKMSTINLQCALDAAGFVSEVVDRFGHHRLVWGSDIGQSHGDYREMTQLARAAVAGLGEEAQRAILHDNAATLYGLRPAS